MSRTYRFLPLLVLAACTANLDVPIGAQITCVTDADCFNGQRCLLDIRLCVDAGQSCVVEVLGGFNSVGNGTTCTQRDGASGVCLGGQCLQSRCGDGYIDPSTSEQCDDGAANSDTAANACRNDCRRGRCGDGILDDIIEVCDDGNTASGDGCREDCKKVEVCSDAVVDAGEDCDDANDNANDGCDRCQNMIWAASRIVGAGGYGGTISDAIVNGAGPVAVDLSGNIYFGDPFTCRLLKIDPRSGTVATIAGTGICTANGANEGLIAHGTPIGTVRRIAITTRGVVHFFDGVYIRSINPQSGRLHNVVGNGAVCVSAGSCPGSSSTSQIALGQVVGLAFDGNDNLYYAESNTHVLRVVPAGTSSVFTLVGSPFTAGSDLTADAPGGDVLMNQPIAIAVSSLGIVYISDFGNNRILVFDALNDRTNRFAGNGASASSADGSIAASSNIRFPGNLQDLAVLRDGRVLFYETGKLRFVGTDGKLGTLAGTGVEGSSDGAALTSQLVIRNLAGTRESGVVFSETQGSSSTPVKIRRVENGAISTIISSPSRAGQIVGQAPTGSSFASIRDIERAPNGDVFIANQTPPFIFRLAGGVGDVEIYAGGGEALEDNVAANSVALGSVNALHAMANGDLVYLDGGRNTVRKIDATTKLVTTLVGAGGSGTFAGDNGPAISARLNGPVDFDLAPNGDMVILDSGNFRIRKVTASTGTITTIAGNGTACLAATDGCGDGASALSASLTLPGGPRPQVRIAPSGDVVFIEPPIRRIRMVTTAGVMQRIGGVQSTSSCPTPAAAGDCGDGGAATSAVFTTLGGIAIDGTTLLVGDGRVRRLSAVSTSATISTAYLSGATDTTRDSLPAAAGHGDAQMLRPFPGGLLFANGSFLRKIENGVVDTVAGLVTGLNDGPAALSELGHPFSLAAIANNRWVIPDGKPSGKVRMLDASTMRVSTVVGRSSGAFDFELPGRLAKYAMQTGEPMGSAYDSSRDTFYFSDAGGDRVRSVSLAGGPPETWTLVDLISAVFPAGLDGPLATASVNDPTGLAYDTARDALWIADTGDGVIRRVDLRLGQVSTLGGQFQERGFAGDGGPVELAFFDGASALAVGPDGGLYIADTINNRVRRVVPSTTGELDGSSIIETVFGDGSPSASGSGAPARSFAAGQPQGLTFDGFGNLWVSTGSSLRIVAAGEDGIVTGEDAVNTVYGTPPREQFPASVTTCLAGVSVLPGDASAFVLDNCLGYVVRVDRQAAP